MHTKCLSVSLALALVVTILATAAFAGANRCGKVAIHLKPYPTSCHRTFPVFTKCPDIHFFYTGCDNIDVLPVFFDLTEYTGLEFGMTWPVEWGTMSWVRCNGSAAIGNIVNSGDGTRIVWSICQTTWAVAPGCGWVFASTPGLVCPVTNPATGLLGTIDCSSSPGPQQDPACEVYCGGACGETGNDPCVIHATEPNAWGSIKAIFK
jgi:hypothetical protein